jgi:hypothetical protein
MQSVVIVDWKSNWIPNIKPTVILNLVATGDIFGPVASTDFSSVICSRLSAFLNERFKKELIHLNLSGLQNNESS